MRVLITGATGFVGPHVVAALRSICGADVAVVATSRFPAQHPAFGDTEVLDVLDRNAIEVAITRHNPSHIIHLAGIAATADVAKAPGAVWRVHVQGTLNVAHMLLRRAPGCCLVNAGSGLVYGTSACSGVAMDETTLLAPIDDYGVTKAAADLALGALARRGLKCVRMRPFNHTGPGQTEAFAIPAFAMQIARIEMGFAEPVIRVGNLDAERDFLDVRDIAAAYALVVAKSPSIEPGTTLNLASGKRHRMGDLLEILLSLSRTRVKTEQDPARMRPSELQRIVGSAERARELLGWRPRYAIEQTLADVLANCRQRVLVEVARSED